MGSKRLALNGILTALALGIFVLEAQLPPLTPIPGIKLGLANLVTLFGIVFLSAKDAFVVLIARTLLGALLVGNPHLLFYSLAGGICCLGIEMLLFRSNGENFLWAISAVGAMVHNTVQVLVAVLITKTPAVFSYLPILWISGILTGLFTGFCVRYIVIRYGGRIRRFFP